MVTLVFSCANVKTSKENKKLDVGLGDGTVGHFFGMGETDC